MKYLGRYAARNAARNYYGLRNPPPYPLAPADCCNYCWRKRGTHVPGNEPYIACLPCWSNENERLWRRERKSQADREAEALKSVDAHIRAMSEDDKLRILRQHVRECIL